MLLKTSRLVYSSEMQKMDKTTISDFKIPGEVLMENAGRTASRIIDSRFCLQNKKTAVLCGPGNNGGDGFVIARYLDSRAEELEIFLLCDPEKLSGDALLNYNRAKSLKIKITKQTSLENKTSFIEKLKKFHIIIDALFGTGLRSAPKGIFKEIIGASNSLDKLTAAVDIPSGIEADTGKILGCAFKSDLTITFGFPKPAHFLNDGKTYTGKLYIADIGIPETISDKIPENKKTATEKLIKNIIIKRPENSHKGNFGHLLIIGGSLEKPGAAVMASKASHRAGAGLVTLCCPDCADTSSCYNETMKSPLPGENGSFSTKAAEELKKIIADKSAVVAGPGMGTGKGSQKIIEFLLDQKKIPVIIDADGLNILAENEKLLLKLRKNHILTPHPKEMSRLTKNKINEILDNQIKAAIKFSKTTGAVIVLKTSTTVSAFSNGNAVINTTGNPGLAAGGSGDILSGITGAFAANGHSCEEAAVAGVFIHGYSADILAQKKGPFGYLPVEVAENLPAAFKKLQN